MSIADVKELNKILRAHIIVQSELDSEQVLNSLSIHGEDLDKLFEEQIYVSIDRADAMILFELQSRQSSSDVSFTEDTDVVIYRSFTLRVMIYGNESSNIANKLVARFRTAEIRDALQSEGVYLEKVSDPDILNEYKNQTMWIRNDIAIDISCEFNIEQLQEHANFDSVSINKLLTI